MADERILLFSDQITPDDAQKRAGEKKITAFSAISQFTSFLSKPKDEDFELTYTEHRYQPFWHVAAKSHYQYDRNSVYQVPVSGTEVKSLTYYDKDYEVAQGHIHLSVIEHCLTDEADEVFVDGVTGKTEPNLKKYLALSPKEVKGDLAKLVVKDSIIVPPQTRRSSWRAKAICAPSSCSGRRPFPGTPANTCQSRTG